MKVSVYKITASTEWKFGNKEGGYLMSKIEQVKKQYGDSYQVVYWETPELRDMGESSLYECNMSLTDAIHYCRKLVGEYAVSAEVRVDNEDSEYNGESVYYCDPDDSEETVIAEWLV